MVDNNADLQTKQEIVMGIRSFLKRFINLLPMYRQGERHSEYLQQLIHLNKIHINYYFRKNFMPDDILKLSTERGDILFYLPFFPNNVTSWDIITGLDFAERQLLDKAKEYISPDSIIADVGANIGNHTLYFSYYLSPRKIYSFEPQEKIFQILQKNIALNNLRNNVQLFNCCVGDKEAFVQFDNIDIKNAGETSFTICDTPTKYKMISLDSLQLEKLDFIKIDVEGHELDVLKGATETIKKCNPVIWCEAWTYGHRNTLYCFLRVYGYSILELDKTNFLFLPAKKQEL